MTATLTYNGYTTDNGEFTISRYEVIPINSPRFNRTMLRRRLHIQGVIIRDNTEDLITRINQFIVAFDSEQASDVVIEIDGNSVPHDLSNNSLTGVRIAYRSWPKGDPHELLKSRTYSVILETLEFASESQGAQIEEYSDTVQVIGTSGPDWRYVQMAVGPARLQILSQQTPVQIIQSGSSLGFQGYVLPPGPVLAGLEQGKERISDPGTPVRMGNVFLHYPWRWRYVMQANSATAAFPTPK